MKYLGHNLAVQQWLTEHQQKWGSPCEAVLVDTLQLNTPGVMDQAQVVMALAGDLDPKGVMNCMRLKQVKAVIQPTPGQLARSLEIASHLYHKPLDFFNQPLGVLIGQQAQNYYEHQSPTIYRYPILAQSAKEDILEEFRIYVKTVPKMNTVRDSSLIIMNELVMNVIYDAPRYYAEQQAKASDEHTVLMAKSHYGEMFAAYNDSYFAVGSIDFFGSLDPQKVIDRLNQTYSQEMVEVSMDPGHGAGLGCRMMYDLSSEFYMGILPNQKTVFAMILPLGLSYRQQQAQPKSLHCVTLKS